MFFLPQWYKFSPMEFQRREKLYQNDKSEKFHVELTVDQILKDSKRNRLYFRGRNKDQHGYEIKTGQ